MRGMLMKMIKILLLALLLVGCENVTYQQMKMDEAIEMMDGLENSILLAHRILIAHAVISTNNNYLTISQHDLALHLLPRM